MTYQDHLDALHLRAAARILELKQAGEGETAATLRRLGTQLYLSDPAAARPEGVYFCGLKPYGAPGRQYETAGLPLPGYSEYRDGRSASPFYTRARRLIRLALDRTLGEDAPLEAALCTNWFFFRAADTAQLKRFGLESIDSRETHRDLLEELRPRIVLCAGNGPVSAYAGMVDLWQTATTEEVNYLGNSKLRRAPYPYGTLIGMPHLSRYEVTEQLLAFIYP